MRAALVALALTLPGVAGAESFWQTPALLKAFFAHSKRVTYQKVTLGDAEAARVEQRTHVKLAKREFTVYIGLSDETVDGYAIIDSERGQHELIDYGVLFSPRGAIARIEIMAYREAYGGEVRNPRFLAQFSGKDASLQSRDIDIISGASISSRSITAGVLRDALILYETLLKTKAP